MQANHAVRGQVSVLTGIRERRYVPDKLHVSAVALGHGTWRSSGGQNLRSVKLQASGLTSFKLWDIVGLERRGKHDNR